MTEWFEIDGDNPAPRDGTRVLLYGTQRHYVELDECRPQVFVGYWDSLDEAWCATGSTWRGPFYDVTRWANCPTPPTEK